MFWLCPSHHQAVQQTKTQYTAGMTRRLPLKNVFAALSHVNKNAALEECICSPQSREQFQ